MLPTEDRTSKIWFDNDTKKLLFDPIGVMNCTSQHLYITVSQDVEPIKEGDWYIDDISSVRKSITSDEYYWKSRQDYVKIIATTDPKLIIDVSTKEQKESYIKEWAVVPQISQSFLKEYVANPDGEYEVEYHFTGRCEDPMVCLRGCSIRDATCRHHLDKGTKLSINNDNTVNITSVKEKMYSKEEVESLLFQYAEDEHAWFSSKLETESFNDWIKENL